MNPLLRRCFVAAIGVHLGILVMGGALAPHWPSDGATEPMRTIDVGLESPEPPPPPVAVPQPLPVAPLPQPTPQSPTLPQPVPTPAHPAPVPPRPGRTAPTRVALARGDQRPTSQAQPGGALNLGAASARGDIEGLPVGRTPVGWVPGADEGKGMGSGNAEGVGTPEPPVAPPAPVKDPVPPPPPPPPAPRRVSVRVCAASRLLPNRHCPEVVRAEFTEDTEPRGVCALHKAPPPPPPPPPPPTPAPPPVAPREEPRFVAARLVRTVKPAYPPSALDGNREGAVSLKVEVQDNGRAGDIEVVRTSGSRVLDDAAIKAVKRWLWEPARRGDTAVTSTVRCRVRFTLED